MSIATADGKKAPPVKRQNSGMVMDLSSLCMPDTDRYFDTLTVDAKTPIVSERRESALEGDKKTREGVVNGF